MPDNEELSVIGPGGIGMVFKGQQLFSVILVLLLSAVFGYLVLQIDTRSESRDMVTIREIDKLIGAAEKADARAKAMIYVLTLSQSDREKLNLLKPKELQDMQR